MSDFYFFDGFDVHFFAQFAISILGNAASVSQIDEKSPRSASCRGSLQSK
jgi:hypothetical protein